MTKNYGFERRRLTSFGLSTKAFKASGPENSAYGRGRQYIFQNGHTIPHGSSGGKRKGNRSGSKFSLW